MRSTDVAASWTIRPAGSLVAPGSSHGSGALSLARGAMAWAPAVSAAGAKANSEALPTD